MDDIKHKVVRGTIWAMLEKLGLKFVGFFVTLILSRLLTPTDYGTVAILGIFVVISEVLIDSGFGQALIQRKNADDLDFNSVFFFSITLSSVLYIGLFCAAPAVARFYNTPELSPILRVTAVNVILYSINGVQNAELSRKMLFHLSFRISMISYVVASGVGVVLAFAGYGPWAIVWSGLSSSIVGTILRWFMIRWRPAWMFSWRSLAQMYSFGWKIFVTGLVDRLYANITSVLIGKFYTRADLAFVDKGRALPSMLMDMVNSTIGRVAFPALAQMQDNREQVRGAVRKMIRTSMFLIFPSMTIMGFVGRDLIYLLFGPQWDCAFPYLCLACFSCAIYPFHTINLQAITAMGYSGIFLKLEIIKKVLGVVVIALSIPHGVFCYVAAATFATGPLCMIINAWPNKRLLDYSIGQQLKDVMPSLFLSVGVGVAVALFSSGYSLLPIDRLMIAWRIVFVVGAGLVGTVSFVALAWLFRMEQFCFMRNVFVEAMARRRGGARR